MKANPRPVKMTAFTQKVIALVRKIPRGQVATYGQIAILAGRPQGARGVSWILNSCSKAYGLPWQRVINIKGKISFRPGTSDYRNQKDLLIKDGIHFTTDDVVSLERYGWKKRVRVIKANPKLPQMFK
jgi:methylated-DNA-protein-cysteine methyltransferase related protein